MARILVVDDDPLFLTIMNRALEKAHHEVVTAADGAKAIALFLGGNFDCLVCDLVLPNLSGLQVIREARHHAPQTAIIAISGGKSQGRSVHLDVLNVAQTAGANAVIKKPFVLSEFVATVERALGAGAEKTAVSGG